MRSWLLIGAGIALVAGYLAFPYHATRALAAALRSGERAALERCIDFDSLRASLRRDLDARGREMIGDGPILNELANLFGGALLDNAVEVYVSPQALATLIETGELSKAAVAGVIRPDAAEHFEIALGDASWAFFSDPTTFQVELPNAGLTLRLQGMWWQLVEVRPKRSGTPPAPKPEDAERAKPPAPAEPSGDGASAERATILISVNADPWATIEIDGTYIGETPLADIPLSEGPHRFRARLYDDRVIERTEIISRAHARIEIR
jgi:hypothetical protein